GFLSQSMLTAPRVYFAMAEDGLFFSAVGKLSRRSRVPVVAIVLQGLLAIVIALSGKYEQILNYVVSVDFIFFGLTALCVFVFRRRLKAAHTDLVRDLSRSSEYNRQVDGHFSRVPGHPITTVTFIAVCWLVVINTVYRYPGNTLIGLVILLAGIPAYFLWQKRNQT
ncbi:MAG: amino acid permease, partial [bacterium]